MMQRRLLPVPLYCLPALSFFCLVPLFLWFAPDTTRKELTDFVGEKI